MSNKIKYDKSLNGVVASVGQEEFEYKSFQYADDISLFLPGDPEIPKVLETVSQFTKVAGPKLNNSKTECIWLGNYKYRLNTAN